MAEVRPGQGSTGPDTPVLYLAIALRNAGNGIAVLHGRFTVLSVGNRDESPDTELRWLATASRHWSIDRPDPR